MKLCSPEGHTLPIGVSPVARPPSLEGLRIGLLNNGKPPVDKMMEHIDRKLNAMMPGVEIYSVSKVTASQPAEAMLQGLRQRCDVVINALGD
ncbi:MAG: hypothetical protein ABIH03_01535 [Pseudomonadota bacterium]